MKPYLPILTAIIGVAIGWLAKPAAQNSAPIVKDQTPPKRQAPAPTPVTPPPASFVDRPSTRPSSPLNRMGTEAATTAVQSRDEAKMLRLAEALNLTKEQQEAIIKMIAAAQAEGLAASNAATTPEETLAAAATIGGNIEKSLDTILSPEQAKAFRDLLKRTELNRLEIAAQKQFSTFLPEMDLTSEQREKALERSRESLEDKQSTRSTGLTLMLDNSILPVGPGSINSRAIGSMEQLVKDQGDGSTGNPKAHFESQRADLDHQFELYKDILTPAQQAQLKLVIDERKTTLDRVNELMR